MVDIAKLKWENIENGRIVYYRSKNKRRHNVPILPPAQEILDYYKGTGERKKPEDYVFPILNDQVYNTPNKIANRVQYATKYTNREIKVIAKALEMPIDITTYMARHTFATNLQKMKIDTGKIQLMLGHRSETTTQGYLDGIKNEDLDQAAMALIA